MKRIVLGRNFAALEARRRAGVALLRKGTTQTEVAHKLGVSRQAVQEWWSVYQQGGWRALRHRKTPGRPRTLTTEQRKTLLQLLKKGALSFGFATDLWTLKRIVELLRRQFGIVFHRSHVHRILRAAKWSCQIPELRAVERNEKQIKQWIQTTWRDAKKKPKS